MLARSRDHLPRLTRAGNVRLWRTLAVDLHTISMMSAKGRSLMPGLSIWIVGIWSVSAVRRTARVRVLMVPIPLPADAPLWAEILVVVIVVASLVLAIRSWWRGWRF
jgi:hypothetical protein